MLYNLDTGSASPSNLLTVESVLLEAVHAAHLPTEGRSAVSTVLPPGRYYVGDPSNVLSTIDYQRLLVQGGSRVYSIRGFRGVYGVTAQSNGLFTTSSGHLCAVHNGTIGVVPLLLMVNPPNNWFGEGAYANGYMLNAAEEVVVIIQNGVLTVAFGFDRRLVLDTRPGLRPATTTDPAPSDDDEDDNDAPLDGDRDEDSKSQPVA